MPDQPADVEAVAARFFAAIEAGDTDAIQAIYAADAVVWHNTDEVEQAVAQNLVVLRWVIDNVKGWHYEDVRRTSFERRVRAAARRQGASRRTARRSRCRPASSGVSKVAGSLASTVHRLGRGRSLDG
jgi:ketosteroid isomerase-like protein